MCVHGCVCAGVCLSVRYRCSCGVRENGRLNLGSADWPIRDCFHVTCSSQFTLLFSLSVPLSFTLILKCLRLYYYPICLFQYLFPFFFFPFNLFSLPHLPIVYFAFTPPKTPAPTCRCSVSYLSSNSLLLFCHLQYTSLYLFYCHSLLST